MERQLKERLIGAAVLLAIAVVMVPEMFSGPHSRSEATLDSSSASSGQIKTYHIELQSAHSSDSVSPAAVEQPAPQPMNELPLPAAAGNVVESSGSASVASVDSSTSSVTAVSSSSISSRIADEPAPMLAAPVLKAVPATKEAPSKNVVASKPVEGDWTVQVGSFGGEDKARQIVATLKGQGYPAYLGKVTVSGKTLYRVRVGNMPSRQAAETTLQKIKAAYPAASVLPANR